MIETPKETKKRKRKRKMMSNGLTCLKSGNHGIRCLRLQKYCFHN